jgi:predicted N-acetyltransferase YhbS
VPVRVEENRPVAAAQLNQLYEAVGWGGYFVLSRQATEACLEKSIFRVALYEGDRVVAFARVSGDPYSAYVNEVVVAPDQQRKGLGTTCMQRIMNFLNKSGHAYAVVLDSSNLPKFYEEFGFVRVPSALAIPRVWKGP